MSTENKPTTDKDQILDQAIATLNALLAADPKASNDLLAFRVEVNDDAAVLPNLLVQADRSKSRLGVLGLLNSILQPVTGDRIALIVDNGECVGVTRVPKKV